MTPAAKIPVDCFRQIMIWPLQLFQQIHHDSCLESINFEEATKRLEDCGWSWGNRDDSTQATNLKDLAWYKNPTAGTAADAASGQASTEQEYDYSEIVYFHSYVRDFLFGGDGKRASERSMRVLRRADIQTLHVDVDKERKYKLRVVRLEAYLFYSGVLLIVADVAGPERVEEVADVAESKPAEETPNIKFSLRDAMDLQNVMRMVFPRRWNATGKPSETPLRVAWGDAAGNPIIESEQDFSKKTDFTDIVRSQAELPAAKHWRYLLKHIPLYGEHQPGEYAIKQIEDQRIPSMTYLSVPNPREISEWDFARIAFFDSAGESSVGSYSDEFLQGWESDSAYDRFWQRDLSVGGEQGVSEHNNTMRTRWLCSGYSFSVVGTSSDKFYRGQIAANFGHHYFRMGLIAHFHRASLLTFRDQLAEATEKSGDRFRDEVMKIQANLTKFRARYWFREVSTQLQGQEIFVWWSSRLGNQAMFDQVTADIAAAESQVRTQMEADEAKQINTITEIGGTLAAVGFLVALASFALSFGTATWQHSFAASLLIVLFVFAVPCLVALMIWKWKLWKLLLSRKDERF